MIDLFSHFSLYFWSDKKHTLKTFFTFFSLFLKHQVTMIPTEKIKSITCLKNIEAHVIVKWLTLEQFANIQML